MRACFSCAALAALLFLPSIARAQTLSLTESDALARLSPESPRLRAIRSAVEIARADVLAAGRWPNPRVTVDRESVAGTTEYITTAGQLLPINGQRGLQMRAASALVQASVSRADDEARRARPDLRAAYAQLVAAQVRETELTAARDRLGELTDVLSKREAAGDAAGFDRLRAEREVLDVDADRAASASDRARAQAALAGFFFTHDGTGQADDADDDYSPRSSQGRSAPISAPPDNRTACSARLAASSASCVT